VKACLYRSEVLSLLKCTKSPENIKQPIDNI